MGVEVLILDGNCGIFQALRDVLDGKDGIPPARLGQDLVQQTPLPVDDADAGDLVRRRKRIEGGQVPSNVKNSSQKEE